MCDEQIIIIEIRFISCGGRIPLVFIDVPVLNFMVNVSTCVDDVEFTSLITSGILKFTDIYL